MTKLVSTLNHSAYFDIDGKEYRPDADGNFDLPLSEVARALSAGFIYPTTSTGTTSTDTSSTDTSAAKTKSR